MAVFVSRNESSDRLLVQVAVRARTEFQVKDPTGARHIVEAKQVTRELRE